MLYKPNFCCSCGEKIERANWSLLTSRRFCGVCETEHKGIDYAARISAGVAALVMVVGAAGYLRSSRSIPSTRPLDPATREQHLASTGSANPASGDVRPTPAASDTDQDSLKPPIAGREASPPANSLQRQITQKPSTETAYYCGALTKKGTACTRRVKTNGRCWQHQGQPSAAEFR